MERRQERSEWIWDGGRTCIDLVNTVRSRWEGGEELLPGPADLGEWLRQAGLTEVAPAVTARQFDEAKELREAIDEGLRATIDRRPVPGPAVDLINAWTARGRQPPAILHLDEHGVPHAQRPAPVSPTPAALAAIAEDAVLLLGTPDRDRLRICESPDCSLRFADHSPGRRRQWCSMSRCGNRAKARAHRQRHRSG